MIWFAQRLEPALHVGGRLLVVARHKARFHSGGGRAKFGNQLLLLVHLAAEPVAFRERLSIQPGLMPAGVAPEGQRAALVRLGSSQRFPSFWDSVTSLMRKGRFVDQSPKG